MDGGETGERERGEAITPLMSVVSIIRRKKKNSNNAQFTSKDGITASTTTVSVYRLGNQ